MLKFDPKNTELLSQKQTVLKKNIAETTEKLKALKEAQDLYIKSGGNLNTAEYRNLQREIINTENKLKNLKVEASNWTNVSRALDNISDKLKTVGDKISGVGKGLTTTVTAPITGLMTAGVQYNAQIEKYTTALKTLTGSSEKARDVIEQIKKDAQATPFDVAGLTQANQLLISTGLSSEESRDAILALGDAISATGGGNEELSRMAVNLQQIKNVGKASAVDIKQFAYAGIDVYGLLADYLGITKQEASQMTVTWDDLNGALINASKEGGKYFGAMEEQSETFNGRLARLKESFQDFTGDLTKAFMPVLEQIMAKFSDLMDKFKALSPEQQEVITKSLLIGAALGPIIMIIGHLISGVSSIIGVVSTVTGVIGKATAGIGGLSKVMSVLTGPVGIVIAVITALIGVFTYLYNTNEDFRNKVQETWEKIVELFQTYVMPVIETLKNLIVNAISTIWSIIQSVWAVLEPFIKNIFESIMSFWQGTGSSIIESLMTVLNELFKAVNWLWENVLNPIIQLLLEKFQPVIESVFAAISVIISSVLNVITNVWNAIRQVFSGIIDFISGVFTGDWDRAWNGIKNIFSGIWNGIKNIIQSVWKAIQSIIKVAIDVVKNIIETVFSIIETTISNIWNGISMFISNIWNGILETISNVINTIKMTISNVLNTIKGIWEKIWNGLKTTTANIFNAIWNTIKNVINSILGGIESMANGVINGINAMIDALNKIHFDIPDWVPVLGGKSFGFNIPNMKNISLPRLEKGGIVDRATLALIGEGKSAEAVIPLDRTLTKYMAEALKEAGNSKQPITVNFYPQEMSEADMDMAFNYINRRFGLSY